MTQVRAYVLLLAFAITRVSSIITSTSYQLQDDYKVSTFASYFDFFTDSDPTAGYVDYLDQATAQSLGIFDIRSNQAYIGVDNSTIPSNSQRGRRSVRLESKKNYNHGLFILDLAHMPGDQCGTWPAFWMISTSKPWPYGGEIDIIEGVNSQTGNSMTMHTDSGCSIIKNSDMLSSSVVTTSNCDIHASGQDENVGCNINSMDKTTYGTGFNAVGGGVYVTEWNSDHIATWFFPRASIPANIKSGQPNPASADWGAPIAMFQGGNNCNIDQHFVDQQIVFDITFCGQWAGQVWATDSICHSLASTCQKYVQNNPTEFTETYWLVNSLKVYQANGTIPVNVTSSSISTATVSVASSTTSSLLQSFTTSLPPSTAISKTSSTSTSSTISLATLPTTILSTPIATPSTTPPTTPPNTPPTTGLATITTIPPTTPLTIQLATQLITVVQPTTQPATQPQSQPSLTAPASWNPGAWFGWQSQARLAPTGGGRPSFWGPPWSR